MRSMVGSQVFPIVMHLASILPGFVAVFPTMLPIGLKVLSVVSEFLTGVVQASPILMKLSHIGLVPYILPRLLPITANHCFVLPEIPLVTLDILIVTAFIVRLTMTFTKLLRVLLHLAPRASRFRESLTEFGLGEDSLGGGRSATKHRHCHTHLYDNSIPHDRSLSWELRDVLLILVSMAIVPHPTVDDVRLRWAS